METLIAGLEEEQLATWHR